VRIAVLGLLGFAGAFALGVLLFQFVLMPRVVQHGVMVEVPEVTGLSIAEARRRCVKAGLQFAEEARRHSDAVPPGSVLAQTPAAHRPVKRGRTVRVVVGLGHARVTVPDVRGMTLRQATLQLENARLEVGGRARVQGTGAAGPVVLATRPGAGAEAALGDSIDLLVAAGDAGEPYLMPALLGQDLGEVRAFVEASGFRVGRVSYRSRRDVYPGTVLEQYPERGARIRRGEAIDLVVATPD
jgi:serine/threonine-protein kinase